MENEGGIRLAIETTKEIEKETANAIGVGEISERYENEFCLLQGAHRERETVVPGTGHRAATTAVVERGVD